MKTLLAHLSILVILISLTMCLPGARAKDFPLDVSFTAGLGYDHGTWQSGQFVSPTGTHHDAWVGFSPAIQLKYNRLKIQPTVEISYRREHFDFSDWQASQMTRPQYLSFLGGFTYPDLYAGISVYSLFGETSYKPYLSMTELYPYLYHGSNINYFSPKWIFTSKSGLYKLWDIWKIKVGPELSLTYYEKVPGYDHCRKFTSNRFIPELGARIQW